jgi:hypothetical protein
MLGPSYASYLRYNEAIIIWIEEVQLESVADAARPMNGCDVGHGIMQQDTAPRTAYK